ncbi:MAG TPA: helix-turn-helix domain-containing protein [Candidatus Nanoarchaeia archaeon]|nr:helix-turn-helix domain-containing protein [Candidatus Nanoarchaeia archaeon]
MVKKEILAALIDQHKAAILRTVLNSKEEMYLKEIASKSNVPLTSAFRILQELVELGIFNKREWKTSKVYSCEKNEKTDFLRELFHEEFDGLQEFVRAVENFAGIQQIILHGAREQNKASVILIGEYINSSRIDEVCKEIKKLGFDLNYLALTRAQYEQMDRMGFYPEKKKVLK